MICIYFIPSDKIRDAKKILENPDVILNKWSRNGYTLRDAKMMGFDKAGSYLYVAGPEDFFKENEKDIAGIETVEKLKDKAYDEIKAKFDSESDSVAAGVSFMD
jgi:hypothetical protein